MVTRKNGRPPMWTSQKYYTYGSAAIQEEEAPVPSRPRKPVAKPKNLQKGKILCCVGLHFLPVWYYH